MIATIGYWICSPFAALLRLFYHLTGSYGVSLILFTLVIKLILLPLQMKSKKSMVRMSRMSGRMQEIQAKYKNNQAKLGEEMQKLYAEEGVNPMSGCVWSLLPMPILIALYYIIREPIVYFMNFGNRAAGLQVVEAARTAIDNAGLTLTSSKAYEQIEMIKVIGSKLPDFTNQYPNWIHVDYNFLGLDLSAVPSSHFAELSTFSWAVIGLMLIPVISGVLSFFLSKITSAGQPQAAGAAGGTTKMMIYMMPLMSIYIGFILPAALGVYWIAQSAFSIVQEALLGKFYNGKLEEEEAARAEIRQKEREKKMEEARLHQEEMRKLSAKQQAAAKKKRAAESQKNTGKKSSTNENGRVGERPYARGRAFTEDRYDENSK